MITNRDLGLDDYLAMARRHLRTVCVLALAAAGIGFAVSFVYSPRYTSSSEVIVERQSVPAGYVKPIVTSAVSDRVLDIAQEVLGRKRLEALVNQLGLAAKGRRVDDVITQIQHQVTITETNPLNSSAVPLRRGAYVSAFYVGYTSSDPDEARQVCEALTSMILTENLKLREGVALGTTDFLARQLQEAKASLDQHDRELADFKGRYLGQLPGDVDNNLKIVMALESQLNAYTQNLNRAQQDKSYTESVLTQQLAAWKSSQTAMTSDTIGQQLAGLQTQLVALQTRYTDDHPEVIRLKSDIAALKAKQKEMQSAMAQHATTDETEGKAEPALIRQLRLQIHQNEEQIAHATREQTRVQKQLATYQSRLTVSPTIEEQYKQLTRDNETAHQIYNKLLVDKTESAIQTDLEHQQQGEQLRLLEPATLPAAPSFPVRWKFAAAGLAVGFAIGMALAFWHEFRDKTLRNEADVLAGLELPTLTSIPFLDVGGGQIATGRFKLVSERQ